MNVHLLRILRTLHLEVAVYNKHKCFGQLPQNFGSWEGKDLFKYFPFLFSLALNIHVMSGAVAAILHSGGKAKGDGGDLSPDILRPVELCQQHL